MPARKRIAVILASHGEAETSGFMENYRVSRHTLSRASEVMHIPIPLQHIISLSSSLKKKMHAGRRSGGGSPQNRLTRSQAALLQRHLDLHPASSGIEFDVRAAHSASEPYVERVLADTMGHDGQVIVPMAPVDNALSCGLLCGHIAGSCFAGSLHRVKVVGRLWSDEALHRAYLDHLFGDARWLPEREGRENSLLLLFHGTLVRDKEGNLPTFRTGCDETAAFARKLVAGIGSDCRNPWGRIAVAYLNHDVGGEWTKPAFEDVCRELAGNGGDHVSIFAAGYFSDGNETIRRAELLAAEAPGVRVESIPCMNDSPVFAGYLAGRVVGAAAQILGFSGDASSDAVTFA
jgi:ferrochelatase